MTANYYDFHKLTESLMKKVVVYDEVKNGDCFNRVIEAATIADAIHEAKREWEHLSEHDKSRRSDFFLAFCELDEDDCPDWNTAEVIVKFK